MHLYISLPVFVLRNNIIYIMDVINTSIYSKYNLILEIFFLLFLMNGNQPDHHLRQYQLFKFINRKFLCDNTVMF